MSLSVEKRRNNMIGYGLHTHAEDRFRAAVRDGEPPARGKVEEVNPFRISARALLPGLVVASLLATSAWGTTIVVRSIQELIFDSDLVVRAVPLPDSAESAWDEDRSMIMTRTTLKVIEVLYGKAKPEDEIVVETLGGTVEEDNISMIVPGTPIFAPSEEVVLFLTRHAGSNALRTVDLSAGKFEVKANDPSGLLTRRDLGTAHSVHQSSVQPDRLANIRALVKAAVVEKLKVHGSKEGKEGGK
jgi:hypothetical protein